MAQFAASESSPVPLLNLFPGLHKEWLGWMSSQTPPPMPVHEPPCSSGWLRGADGKRLLFQREGENNLWLPMGEEAYLSKGKVRVGCCCPGVMGTAAVCVGRVKIG